MNSFLSDFGGFAGASISPSVHAGHDGGGGLVAVVDHLLAALTDDGGASPASWHLLGGIDVMGANIHPLIVHFPVAFLSAFAFFEFYGVVFKRPDLRRFASGLLYLGAVASIATVIAGLVAAEMVPHGAVVHDIMEWHEYAGITVASVAVILALWRAFTGVAVTAMGLALNFFLITIMSVVMIIGADLGGMMVYKHGVGVHDLQDQSQHQHHLHSGEAAPSSPAMTPEDED
jgi:uncharacterized membrane protein